MSRPPSYVAAAFNARPFGMPVPPNWFALAATGLLGALVNPAFLLIGAGLEGLYLWALSRHPRFRAIVDAEAAASPDWQARYDELASRLDDAALRSQEALERQAAEIADILVRNGAAETQIADVRQLAWLHLKLLAIRGALVQVVASATRERGDLEAQEARLDARLAREALDDGLRRSLEQQLATIRTRRAAHGDADRRRELVESEIERLRQQIALVREQALLATDDGAVAQSLDAIGASLNEANRWLKDQHELFAGLDALDDEPPPAAILQPRLAPRRRTRTGESA